MMSLLKSEDRGRGTASWLDSYHSFSFADYHDPAHMGYGPLRVINEDRIAPAAGFGMHGHKDMEIVTYMISGVLRHRDDIGNEGAIREGDVQRMSAGTGIRHSEINGDTETTAHLLQIWLYPDAKGHTPGYAQRHFDDADKRDRLRLIVSGDGRDGSLAMNRDADIYAAILSPGTERTHRLGDGRKAWLQMVRGRVTVNGETLSTGDAAGIADTGEVTIRAEEESEFLLFDMA